jgi:hypothetical protein
VTRSMGWGHPLFDGASGTAGMVVSPSVRIRKRAWRRNVTPSQCAKCAADLHQPPTGRRKTYCGPACRRAAEYELRRLQRRIEAAERTLDRAREELEFGYGDTRSKRKRVNFAQRHLEQLEERLRALLCDDDVRAVPA